MARPRAAPQADLQPFLKFQRGSFAHSVYEHWQTDGAPFELHDRQGHVFVHVTAAGRSQSCEPFYQHVPAAAPGRVPHGQHSAAQRRVYVMCVKRMALAGDEYLQHVAVGKLALEACPGGAAGTRFHFAVERRLRRELAAFHRHGMTSQECLAVEAHALHIWRACAPWKAWGSAASRPPWP